MEWTKLLSSKRFGRETDKRLKRTERSEFQTDFDRIIFSNAFRRLQNKTQVVPLPKRDFIHTRLTHSLEASCVGRSLGRMVALMLLAENSELENEFNEIGVTPDDVGALVATACLAHDIGNPPFGHSGEDALAEYYKSDRASRFLVKLNNKEKADLQNFEGNASGFRLLTHTFPTLSELPGRFALTYATLGAIVKYPKESLPDLSYTGKASEIKYGFFQSELPTFQTIAKELGMKEKNIADCYSWHRHPLSFLVEAADDICYQIIDFEDGYKLKLISYKEVKELLEAIIHNDKDESLDRVNKILDEREKIGYLRAKAINVMIKEIADEFVRNSETLMLGEFDKPLLNSIEAKPILEDISKLSKKYFYESKPVIEIESAGFEVLSGLLDAFLNSAFDFKLERNKKNRNLIPYQYLTPNGMPYEDDYTNIINITLFVAGMTDVYAIDTYRTVKGISLPNY